MRNRYLGIALALVLVACQKPAAQESAAPPDQDWQALISSQSGEIQRLSAEVERLRRGCDAPALPAANVVAPPRATSDWRALLETQKQEIHRLETEVERLRRGCRESAELEPEGLPAAEASELPAVEPATEGKPRISRFAVSSPLAAGEKTKLDWKVRIENPAAQEQIWLVFEAFDEEGSSLATWGLPTDLPGSQVTDYTKSYVVSSVTKPTRVRLILKTKAGDVATSLATVLDTSPVEPLASSATSGTGPGDLIILRSPALQVSWDSVFVGFTLWNRSGSEELSQSVDVVLFKDGQEIDRQTVQVERLAPRGEKDFVVTMRSDKTNGPFTAQLVF